MPSGPAAPLLHELLALLRSLDRDFAGVFQSLRLEEGEYQVELVLPGYEPLGFDVRIIPGEKITYKGDLIPEQP